MISKHTQLVSEIESKAKEVLCGVPGLKLAMLHGSVATGMMRTDSDVDLALLFDHPLDAEQKMLLISQLESELKREVDLVDLFSLSGTILKQVLRKGRVLIETQPGARSELIRKMIYNQTDMMPYVTRTLIERQQRFIDG
ncbi:MAG: nucleotidyltransferase domain-containing protein [Pontiella sp.]